MPCLGSVESSNGGFWLCEGPGLARISSLLVDGLMLFAKHFTADFAAYQQLRSQISPVTSCLDISHSLPPF